VGDYPGILLTSPRINDAMGRLVANEVVKLLVRRGSMVAGSHALVLGFTFKEDCPDLRNTRVVEVVEELRSFGMTVSVFDPWADAQQAREEYGIELLGVLPDEAAYDAIVLAVAHRAFADLGAAGVRRLLAPTGVIYDVKGLLPAEAVDARL